MKKPGTTTRPSGTVRCAIYTRKSSEEGLEQEFNSLQAQREACEAFIDSQRHEGWVCLRTGYDDGGFSGATMGRPTLQRLLADITAGQIDIDTVVVYKIDRLTRSLADFAKIVEILDTRGASLKPALGEAIKSEQVRMTAAIFYAKTKMGWKETVVNEQANKDDKPFLVDDARQRLIDEVDRIRARNEQKAG